MRLRPTEATVACPDCGQEITIRIDVFGTLETDDGEAVVRFNAEPDLEALWEHGREFHGDTR